MSPVLTVVPPTGAGGGSPSGGRLAETIAGPDDGAERAPAGDRGSTDRRHWVCVRGGDGRLRTAPVRGIWLDGGLVFRTEDECLATDGPSSLPAAVVQMEDEERLTIIEGSATRVEEPTVLARFASEFEAKYGFEPGPGGADVPIYSLRVT